VDAESAVRYCYEWSFAVEASLRLGCQAAAESLQKKRPCKSDMRKGTSGIEAGRLEARTLIQAQDTLSARQDALNDQLLTVWALCHDHGYETIASVIDDLLP